MFAACSPSGLLCSSSRTACETTGYRTVDLSQIEDRIYLLECFGLARGFTQAHPAEQNDSSRACQSILPTPAGQHRTSRGFGFAALQVSAVPDGRPRKIRLFALGAAIPFLLWLCVRK